MKLGIGWEGYVFSCTVVSNSTSFSFTSLESNRLILSFNIFCAPSSPMRFRKCTKSLGSYGSSYESKSHHRSIANMDFQSSVQQMSHHQDYTSVSVTYCQPFSLLNSRSSKLWIKNRELFLYFFPVDALSQKYQSMLHIYNIYQRNRKNIQCGFFGIFPFILQGFYRIYSLPCR